MIQSINSATNNPYQKTNVSFAQKKPASQVSFSADKSPRTSNFMTYIGTQFAAGAVFSTVWHLASNGIKALTKSSKPMASAKGILASAVSTGSMFALIGCVFAGIDAVSAKRRNK